MIQRLIAFIPFIALVGCAPATVKLPVANLAVSEKTHVEDLRPASEKTQEVFSYLITNERFGYRRLPQEATDPSGARLFSHLLQEKYGDTVVPPTKLKHFVVYLDERAAIKRTSLAAAGFVVIPAAGNISESQYGVINSLVDSAEFNAASGDSEYQRAISNSPYSLSGKPIYVIYIESESGSKNRFTRTTFPMKNAPLGFEQTLYEAMDAAIRFNLSD